MFRRSAFAFAFLLTVGALPLMAAASPKAPPPVKPAAAPGLIMPDGSPISIKWHNGAVLKAVEAQTVFLGDWKSGANPALRGQLNAAVDTVVTGAYLDALSPYYGVGHGVHDSTADVPQTFVNNTMTDDDLQKLILGWVGNPLKRPDANRLYVIYLQPGYTVTPWAAAPGNGYHGSVFDGSKYIPYAVINTSGQLFGATSVSSHEIAEAATNPSGGGYYEDAVVNKTSTSPGYNPEIGDFTDGPVLDGKQYPYDGANLNGVNVQLLIDPSGNVIQVPGATPDHAKAKKK